jgi:hypothetical protein
MKPKDTTTDKTKTDAEKPRHIKTHVVRNRHIISVRRVSSNNAIVKTVPTRKQADHNDEQK